MKERLIPSLPDRKKFFSKLNALILVASSCTGGMEEVNTTPSPSALPITGVEKTTEPQRRVDLEQLKTTKLRFPWRKGEGSWYLLNGPHEQGTFKGKGQALDLAPGTVTPCKPGDKNFLENNFVSASASGKVIFAKDSVVKIQHESGLTTGYMHVANIDDWVKEGQQVFELDPLGNPSCLFPPGGSTTGIHLHFFVEADGKPISIYHMTLEGWKVNEDGTMTKEGEEKRTADPRRCGPSKVSIERCGLRNDLPNPLVESSYP